MTSTSPRQSPAARDAVVLTLIAVVVNFTRLGATSLWLDEASSVVNARLPLPELVELVARDDPNMGLYYVLLSGWVRLFGESEVAVRSLSAIFASLAVPAMYLLGARLFGRTGGLVGALLLGLNTFVIGFAQTARSYALLVLLVIVASYFFVAELEAPSRRNRIGYVVAGALAFYSHYFAVFVLAAHALTLLVTRRRKAFTREWLAVAAALLVLCSPKVYLSVSTGAGAGISWIRPPVLTDVRVVVTELAGGNAILLVGLLALGAYAAVRAARTPTWWRHGFVATWLLAPLALAYAISLVQPMFIAQYLVICAPALALFGASGVASVRNRAAAGVLAVVLMVISARDLASFYGHNRHENWRDATRYVIAAAHPGDAIVFFPEYARKPYEYYVRRQGVAGPEHVQRDDSSARARRDRVWLLIRESTARAEPLGLDSLRSLVRVGHVLRTREPFFRVSVELYTR